MRWFGLGLLGVWLLLFLARVVWILRARRIPATVVAIELGGEDGDAPAPVVEYVHPNGDKRRCKAGWYGMWAGVKVGDPMVVLVVGDRARLSAFSELWLMTIVLAGAAALVAATIAVVSR